MPGLPSDSLSMFFFSRDGVVREASGTYHTELARPTEYLCHKWSIKAFPGQVVFWQYSLLFKDTAPATIHGLDHSQRAQNKNSQESKKGHKPRTGNTPHPPGRRKRIARNSEQRDQGTDRQEKGHRNIHRTNVASRREPVDKTRQGRDKTAKETGHRLYRKSSKTIPQRTRFLFLVQIMDHCDGARNFLRRACPMIIGENTFCVALHTISTKNGMCPTESTTFHPHLRAFKGDGKKGETFTGLR
ncbi:hypothetical protein B0T26DRAFT_532104 [Lasiosphaeria miniovina]|uniref:Uncharacterized protein n=1 Tax=Lasiosphaeria miniovina TaxID=1954250 RepID=A0AA39ZQH9_9PEZI|nr:uncharacterized protein B0T26DRAFT_532104 [Lasiosphaeria miniovina]KAK0701807.1 hypothetical protein B0T26DRAFT_532104 [Lasiosphaeria miniovina]